MRLVGAISLCLLLLAGCRGTAPTPIQTVEHVDIERFMGEWYVIASIPTFLEREAYNALESYELAGDGRIETTFTFRKGGFDGPLKTMKPTGFVKDGGGNAVWGMQFIWPFRAEYRIVFLDAGYQRTIIGRSRRDYAWLMARDPHMDEATYQRMLGILERLGYDVSQVRRVPQRWPVSPAERRDNDRQG